MPVRTWTSFWFLVGGGNIPEGKIKTAMFLDTKCTGSTYLVLTNHQLFGRRLQVESNFAKQTLTKQTVWKPSDSTTLRCKTLNDFPFRTKFQNFSPVPHCPHMKNMWSTSGGCCLGGPWYCWWFRDPKANPPAWDVFKSPGKIMGFQVPTGPTGEPVFWTISSIFVDVSRVIPGPPTMGPPYGKLPILFPVGILKRVVWE